MVSKSSTTPPKQKTKNKPTKTNEKKLSTNKNQKQKQTNDQSSHHLSSHQSKSHQATKQARPTKHYIKPRARRTSLVVFDCNLSLMFDASPSSNPAQLLINLFR